MHLTATVRPDLQSIIGEIEIHGEGVRLEDVLSMLPQPEDESTAWRTWPAAPETGWVHITPLGKGHHAFYAILPRRYGASGMVPGKGLFVNGLWHPQPMRGGAIEPVRWDVEVTLPEGSVGALNSTTGAGVLRWQGQADRLSLAVIPGGEIHQVPLEAGELVVVDASVDHARDARLAAVLEESWPGPQPPQAVVVITPSRRRLSRPGAGLLFLSDRTFRVSAGMWHYHVPAVREGLLAATLPIEERWQRELVASTIAQSLYSQPTPAEVLGWLSWIPQIDDLLYDGQLPFFSEIFAETWPGDPLADDLQEILDRQVPGGALAYRIDAVYGAGTTARLSAARLSGASMADACAAVGVAAAALEDWKDWRPPAELSIDVAPAGLEWAVTITREADEDAPIDPVTVVIDGVSHTVLMGPGPDTIVLRHPSRPRSATVDPDHVLLQTDRADDRWPNRWTTTLAFFPYELTVRQGRISAFASVSLRKQYDTRWRYSLGLYTDPENLIGSRLTATRYLGPLLDRRYRALRLWGGVGGAVLDPDFRPTLQGAAVVEALTGIAWDTRPHSAMATRGHRLSASTSIGGATSGASGWASGQLAATGLLPLSGRLTLAGRAKRGLASGTLAHRQLPLGGSGAVAALPADAIIGTQRAIGSAELRWVPLKLASVPLPLLWVSDVQLSGGIDAGVVGNGQETWQAVGWSAGVAVVADILGASPNLGGIWLAGPLWSDPSGLADPVPEIYVRISQTF